MRNVPDYVTKKINVLIAFSVILLAALGCGGASRLEDLTSKDAEKLGEQLGNNFNEAKDAAQKVAEGCLELLKTSEVEKFMGCFGDEFYQVTPKEKFLELLTALDKKLGQLQSYELVNWQARVQLETEGGKDLSTFVVLIYKTKSDRFEAQTQLTLLRHTDHDEFKIIGYQVQSDALVTQ